MIQAWFGIVALFRGLFLSLPSVAVPNRPNVQLVLLHTVMLLSLVSWTDAGPGSLSTWIKLDPPPRLGGIALVANMHYLKG